MPVILLIIILLILFALLGWAADLAVKNIRLIALSLRMKIFALGVILGIMTTLPELMVGLNATFHNVASLSVGNIMGGIVVVIGLVLGMSLILNRKIDTADNLRSLLPTSLVTLSPFFLGVDGSFGLVDGIIMIFLYLGLIFYLYFINYAHLPNRGIVIIGKRKIVKKIFITIFGVLAVVLISRAIIQITLILLEQIKMSKLMVGLLLFSIGTNLPEIMITVTAWRHKTSELSLSYLTSSAFTNILVLGLLAILSPITFTIGPVYYALAFFVTLIIILFIIFSHTKKSLSRLEGMILLMVYILFVAFNLFLAGS